MSKANTPWTSHDERHLINLRDTCSTPWDDIATILSRNISGCQQHYSILKQATASSLVTWTPAIDHAIIDARGRGLSIKNVSAELGIWAPAVTDRWAWLLRSHSVPPDVLAVWRRKEDVVFTADEDAFIVKMYIQGLSDEQIYKECASKEKSRVDVVRRRKELTNEGAAGGLYVRMLGVGNGEVKTGLDRAMGKKKYGWMK
ncbi:hypothetical protein BDU57DRAFT_561573 [Ampelomyces quisqualis]|uniref:Myb-like domain-containing protein n=1 Tax=Ampelomyces quisqualis TaxID=50730 RepID=A0A6A5QXD3_AMPQU|nr:hypothetical protein BDU57DRAFT_561573 [Ampelomyces quisqualis]